jgi:hypothetical protein
MKKKTAQAKPSTDYASIIKFIEIQTGKKYKFLLITFYPSTA